MRINYSEWGELFFPTFVISHLALKRLAKSNFQISDPDRRKSAQQQQQQQQVKNGWGHALKPTPPPTIQRPPSHLV